MFLLIKKHHQKWHEIDEKSLKFSSKFTWNVENDEIDQKHTFYTCKIIKNTHFDFKKFSEVLKHVLEYLGYL